MKKKLSTILLAGLILVASGLSVSANEISQDCESKRIENQNYWENYRKDQEEYWSNYRAEQQAYWEDYRGNKIEEENVDNIAPVEEDIKEENVEEVSPSEKTEEVSKIRENESKRLDGVVEILDEVDDYVHPAERKRLKLVQNHLSKVSASIADQDQYKEGQVVEIEEDQEEDKKEEKIANSEKERLEKVNDHLSEVEDQVKFKPEKLRLRFVRGILDFVRRVI